MKAAEFFDYSFLKPNEHDDIDVQIANIMPQLYFVTQYALRDIKEQYRLRKSLESDGQVLDSAIQHFFNSEEQMKFYALFKKRFLIAPTVTQTETPNGSPAV